MAKTVWKYALGAGFVNARASLQMPEGARILTAQIQDGELCLWALVDSDAPRERVDVSVYGTGHPMPDNPGEYIGTAQLMDGSLVFHVFRDAPEAAA